MDAFVAKLISSLMTNEWYRESKSSNKDEVERIMMTAAKIVINEIKQLLQSDSLKRTTRGSVFNVITVYCQQSQNISDSAVHRYCSDISTSLQSCLY